MPTLEETAQQQRLLHIYRQTLHIYLEQRAKMGAAFAPPSVMNGIIEARDHIGRIKGVLRDWDIAVEDHLDDDEQNSLAQVARATVVESIVPITHSPEENQERGAIYLSRIINPPSGFDAQKSTIWLAATGSNMYFIDSVTIYPGFLRPVMIVASRDREPGEVRSGVLPLDVNYKLSFTDRSVITHALDPALVLNPRDRQEISFALGLVPDHISSDITGRIRVILHYHTSNGVQGNLYLEDAPREGKYLAKLLEYDVEVRLWEPSSWSIRGDDDAIYRGPIITPTGVQRGHDDGGVSPLIYQPIYYHKRATDGMPVITLSQDRLVLNAAISSKRVILEIFRRLKEGDSQPFDLCAGLDERVCEIVLLKLVNIRELARLSLDALIKRHLIYPGNTLADVVLRPAFDIADREDKEKVARALIVHPIGHWLQALIKLSESGLEMTYLADTVFSRKLELSKSELDVCENALWMLFETTDPLKWSLIAVAYLRWRGYAKNEIERRVLDTSRQLRGHSLRAIKNRFHFKKEILGRRYLEYYSYVRDEIDNQ